MATIFKKSERKFGETPGRIDGFRLMTDASITGKGLKTKNLNFDVRRLDPGQYSTAYHSHRYAEELFMILSGEATLRTPEGLQTVESGDIIFFEMGDMGAHQLFNHTDSPCVYLDIRTSVGHDVCDYPDSGKILLAPAREVFKKDSAVDYFEGERNVSEIWEGLWSKQTK